MSKYIDVERLKAEIERRRDGALMRQKNHEKIGQVDVIDETIVFELNRLLSFIDSLQREQSEDSKGKFVFPKFLYARTTDNKIIDVSYVPQSMDAIEYVRSDSAEVPLRWNLVAEIKHHFATTPREQLEKEWKELEPWGNIRRTVQEFLYGKQPEVELEKGIDDYLHTIESWQIEDDPFTLLAECARHFYELGLNTRKEK